MQAYSAEFSHEIVFNDDDDKREKDFFHSFSLFAQNPSLFVSNAQFFRSLFSVIFSH
jgi:hypothetical protein